MSPDALRFSCHLNMWGERYQDGMACLRDTPISGIEIGSAFIMHYERNVRKWTELTDMHGLETSAIYEFGHFDNWNRRREIYLHHDRLAALLGNAGINLAVLGPGIRFQKHRTAEDDSRLIRMIVETAKRYEARGVKIAVHPHWGHCIFDEDEIDRTMENTPESVGLVPDLGHTAEAGVDILPLLQAYLSRIPCIHLKDYQSLTTEPSRKYERRLRFCEVGKGEANVPQLIKYLRQAGYKGWLTLESEEEKTKLPGRSAHGMIEYLRRLEVR